MRSLSLRSCCILLLGVAFFGLIVTGSVASASVDPVALCKEKKAKAAGKKTFDHFKAYGKDAKKPNAEKLAADISKSESKFAKAFSSVEAKGGCDPTGDAAAVEAKVDDFVRYIRCLCGGRVGQETVTIPSEAQPAETPGTFGVDNSAYPKLVTMFGGTDFSLNNATYTRYHCGDGAEQPDAILILIPGFEGGAANFKILAENAVLRALEHGMSLEVWAFDRRGHQIEDLVGQDIAEAANDAGILLDWFYGAELGFSLHPALVAGPNRRAEFHNEHEDTAFMANWTYLAFSQDIDAVVEAARSAAANQNVFLGGHSAGTGFTARYASTDFDLSGVGPAEPGYAKLRGLVLLDGGGGSSAVAPLNEDQLDQIEDKADGGLFYAVRENEPKCVDGTTCADDSDCVGHGGHEMCTQPTAAYAIVPGMLNPRVMAAGEVTSIQGKTDPDGGESLIGVDFGDRRCVGGANAGSTCADDTDCDGGTCKVNDAIRQVPDLNGLALLGKTTAAGGLGGFMDDDGLISSLATFVQTSLGAPGPVVGGLQTWLDITEGPMPPSVLPYNGPPPTSLSLPSLKWGQEKEVTRMDRLMVAYYTGATNFTDYYYPSGGNSTTSGIGLDSTQLSVDRGRRDIENLTQAANVNIPVICFGGSNGATPVPGNYVPFAQSLGTCTAPSCDTSTPRVVDPALPNEAFPTLGGVAGGFEVHISEGYAHLDMLVAEDGEHNNVVGPLVDFLMRNAQE